MKNQQDSIGINIAFIKLSSYELICTGKNASSVSAISAGLF
jgi:hypothetical protein